ncbi:MAG: HAD family hydrolase [Pseudomonadota bacterium]
MNFPLIRGIIFDKDGTLFDFATTWEAWAAALLNNLFDGDRTRATAAGAAIGFDLSTRRFRRDSVAIAGTVEDIVDALAPTCPDLGRDALTDRLNAEAETAPQSETVDLVPFLSGLRARGLALGVATNDAEAPARAHLDSAGVTALFDFVAGFDSGHGGKPAPGQLLAFCAQVGLDPDEVVMVGDSLQDLRAGRAAGMRTLGVLTGMAQARELAPLSDQVLPDIGHIPAWLDQQSGSVTP